MLDSKLVKLNTLSDKCSWLGGDSSASEHIAGVMTAGTGKVLTTAGLATVTIIQNSDGAAGYMFTEAVVVNVFAVYVGGHQVTPAQTIIIGACEVLAVR